MKDNTIDWMILIPAKNMTWELNPETNHVIIKKPKFKNAFLKKYFTPKLKNPDYSVKLDEIGTFVWKNMDGKLSIGDIAQRMKKEFGDSIEPAGDRLIQFLHSLVKHEFIKLFEPE